MYAANFGVNNDFLQSSIWRIPICPSTAPGKRRNRVRKGQGCLTLVSSLNAQWFLQAFSRLLVLCFWAKHKFDSASQPRGTQVISEENSSILTDLDNELRVLGERVAADSRLGGGLLPLLIRGWAKKIWHTIYEQWAALTWTLLYHVVWACNRHKGCRGHL